MNPLGVITLGELIRSLEILETAYGDDGTLQWAGEFNVWVRGPARVRANDPVTPDRFYLRNAVPVAEQEELSRMGWVFSGVAQTGLGGWFLKGVKQ